MKEKELIMKPHFICTGVENDYQMKWIQKIIDTQPILDKQNRPLFIIVSSTTRLEVNTLDMKYLENCAKRLTYPKGRTAYSTDKAWIYIKEINNKETLIGVLTHNRIKQFVPVNKKQAPIV